MQKPTTIIKIKMIRVKVKTKLTKITTNFDKKISEKEKELGVIFKFIGTIKSQSHSLTKINTNKLVYF